MKALSLRQPWASLIIYGGKDIENRRWETKYRGPLLIHASKARPPANLIEEIEAHGFKIPRIELGGIIGWVLENSRPLKFHPCVGKLGLFNVNFPHIEAANVGPKIRRKS